MDQNDQQNQRPAYSLPTDDQVYGTPANKPPSKAKLTVVALLMLSVLLLAIGVVGYAITNIGKKPANSSEQNRSSNEQLANEDVQVPDDWETIVTDYKFNVKAPSNWEKGLTTDSDFTSLQTTQTTISEPLQEDENGNEQPANSKQIISAGSNSLKDNNDQSNFESYINDTDKVSKEVAAALSIDSNQVKTTTSKVKLNGKELFRVESSAPNQQTTTYYAWKDDHAISISYTQLDSDKTKYEEYVKQFLKPIAASFEFEDTGE